MSVSNYEVNKPSLVSNTNNNNNNIGYRQLGGVPSGVNREYSNNNNQQQQ